MWWGEEAGVEKGEGAHWGKALAAKPVGKRISSHKVFPDLHVHHAYTRTDSYTDKQTRKSSKTKVNGRF